MAKSIWKYPLEGVNRQEVMMPSGAEVLYVQTQHGRPCLWALVDASADPDDVEPVVIETFGTGHPIYPDDAAKERAYIGSYQMSGGALVFHAFRSFA